MSKKLLALDIDGTLTNTQKDITPATLEKIIEAQEKGHIVHRRRYIRNSHSYHYRSEHR